jgi:Fe-S-cluster-containing hydrogenase component 2
MMTTKTKVLRKMVRIDEEKCNGCEACVLACAEGAIQIIDGKTRLIEITIGVRGELNS